MILSHISKIDSRDFECIVCKEDKNISRKSYICYICACITCDECRINKYYIDNGKCPNCREDIQKNYTYNLFLSYLQMENEVKDEKIKKLINYKLISFFNVSELCHLSKKKYIEIAEKAEAYLAISSIYKNKDTDKEIFYLKKSIAIKEEKEYEIASVRLANLYFNNNQKEKVIELLKDIPFRTNLYYGDDMLLYLAVWFFENNIYEKAFILFEHIYYFQCIYKKNSYKYLGYMYMHGKGTKADFEKGWEFYGCYLKENEHNKKVKNIKKEVLNTIEKTLKLK